MHDDDGDDGAGEDDGVSIIKDNGRRKSRRKQYQERGRVMKGKETSSGCNKRRNILATNERTSGGNECKLF
jgi:hypothetical protein